MKPSFLSGIKPSGALHVGNYLGALKNFVEIQNSEKYQPYFFIADLHSLTEPSSPADQVKQTVDLCATYLAAGLDPQRSTLFIQSQVPAHSQLAWVLNTITPMGELARMTQYKDKAERSENNVGLFDYPVLMAADIILYDAAFVPVGNDQDQHLELTRTLARKFNSKFGQTFIEPKALHTSTPRVMSLDNPEKKMSKSQPGGCLFLDDEPDVIKKKIMSAVTDSGSEVKYDEVNKAGISNLLTILSAFSGKEVNDLEREFADKNYGQFKTEVAFVTAETLAPMREKKTELMKEPARVLEIFAAGSKNADKIASAKIAEVYKKIGLSENHGRSCHT